MGHHLVWFMDVNFMFMVDIIIYNIYIYIGGAQKTTGEIYLKTCIHLTISTYWKWWYFNYFWWYLLKCVPHIYHTKSTSTTTETTYLPAIKRDNGKPPIDRWFSQLETSMASSGISQLAMCENTWRIPLLATGERNHSYCITYNTYIFYY